MNWLDKVVDEALALHPEGQILVSSGASPSGPYHFGHLREVIFCDAIVLAIRERGREAQHVHVVDNFDAFRKVPANIPESYSKYLGMPLCDMPAPDGSERSYADFYLDPFLESMQKLGIQAEIVYQDQKYRAGYYVPAIERSLQKLNDARQAIVEVSGRKLNDDWTPVQIMENGRLKNRQFVGLDTDSKTISFVDSSGKTTEIRYDDGSVKIDWRLDWPGRWWLMGVAVEPFGRDHATKGGSYDTGVEIAKRVYGAQPPVPVPYDFINRTGDTKKMSASKGTGINAQDITDIMPAEIVRYFILRFPASKRLFFDEADGLIKLVDDYAVLLAKEDKTDLDKEILRYSNVQANSVISRVPFSYLIDAYQASLRDPQKTLEVLSRSEYAEVAQQDAEILLRELKFVDIWLQRWAPERVKFSLIDEVDKSKFSDDQINYLAALAERVVTAPADADGAWFHNCIYEFKEKTNLPPRDLFTTLYEVIIGKSSGPRAGHFLSILPRDWLIARLKFEK